MTKQELLNEIDGKRETGKASIGIAYIVASKAWVETFKNYNTHGSIIITSSKNEHVFEISDPKKLIERYDNFENLEKDGKNTILLAIRDMITGTYELIGDYCRKTNQGDNLKKLPWFQFTRLIRNSFNHNFNLDFSKIENDQKIQFSDKEIEFKKSMDGQEIDLDLFPIKYSFELWKIMKDSVVSDID